MTRGWILLPFCRVSFLLPFGICHTFCNFEDRTRIVHNCGFREFANGIERFEMGSFVTFHRRGSNVVSYEVGDLRGGSPATCCEKKKLKINSHPVK